MTQSPTRMQVVLDHVCEAIIAGKIHPGGRISEKALARELGCSIIPVREALGHLISLGVFEKVPHHGTFARQLTPEELLAHAECRLVSYTHAVGRAAARPDPTGLAALKEAMAALETHARGAAAPGLSEAPEEEWLAFFQELLVRLLAAFEAMVQAAGLAGQADLYRQSDLLYIVASRGIWSALSREAMLGFIRDMYVDDPMGCFLPALEAGDSQQAQRLHFEQHQRMTDNVMRRLVAAGVQLPRSGVATTSLACAAFTFHTPDRR